MKAPLSVNETEALTRFVSKLIDDVDKLATLFESRGADASLARAAHINLKRTLEGMQEPERFEIPTPTSSRNAADISYNRLS